MNLEDFANWLSQTPLSIALTDSETAFPAIESLHVIAITLVVGSIAIVDLRLLGLAARRRDASELIASILPITWSAFALGVVTGILLFAANPIGYSANAYFLGKLILLALAGANMIAFHLFAHRHLVKEGALAPKLSGGASLSLWVAIVTFGRLIGFTL
jgi:hypothetical protein